MVQALARIGVLVEMRAVEQGEPVRVVGEVAGHPVEDDADAVRDGRASTKAQNSSGVPKRLVGANSETG